MSRTFARRGPAAVVAALACLVFVAAPSGGSSAAPVAARLAARVTTSPPAASKITDPHALDYGLRVPVYDAAQPPSVAGRKALRAKVPTSDVRAHTQAMLRTQAFQTASVQGARSLWIVNFAQSGSFDVPFTADAQAAFTRAVKTWADQVYSPVPIHVDAHWSRLTDAYQDSGILGAAGPTDFYQSNPNSADNTVFPSALVNALVGSDLDPATPEIDAAFNSQYQNGSGWYFGTGAPSGSQEDLQSVVTHELGHGLGFISSFGGGTADGCPSVNVGCYSDVPFIFDRFVALGASGNTALLDFPNNTAQLFAAETSDNVFWAGTWGQVWGGFTRPKLYFPTSWLSGSSGSHLDESTYPESSGNGLMTPYLETGEVERTIGTLSSGMMYDIGWTHQSDAEAFIRAAYQDFLGRPPSASDLTFYLPNLRGFTRGQIARNLTKTNEWLDVIFTGFYQNTLGRSPSRSELDAWENLIRNGSQTITTAGASFYASDEYFQAHSGSNLQTWVGNLYSAILGRSASASDKQFWADQATAKGRHFVARTIYQSPESRQARVRALYVKLLKRQPDAGGLAAWSAKLLTQDDLVLAASLAGSEEYLILAQGRYLFS